MSVPTYHLIEDGVVKKEKAGFLTQSDLLDFIK
jgi:hypothetical protein